MTNNEKFGHQLMLHRKETGMSQVEFAEACSISRAYYGRVERGEHSITVEKCFIIANFLGLHISDLFREID